MKIFLDDTRPAPEGWILAKTAREAQALIQGNEVEEISLDHDLGHDIRNGGWVLTYLEIRQHYGLPIPKIYVHSANPTARKRMELGIKRLEERREWIRGCHPTG